MLGEPRTCVDASSRGASHRVREDLAPLKIAGKRTSDRGKHLNGVPGLFFLVWVDGAGAIKCCRDIDLRLPNQPREETCRQREFLKRIAATLLECSRTQR